MVDLQAEADCSREKARIENEDASLIEVELKVVGQFINELEIPVQAAAMPNPGYDIAHYDIEYKGYLGGGSWRYAFVRPLSIVIEV